jgi:hypothetical protein
VKAKIEPKLCITIGAITEISPKGFTLGIKAEIFNYFNLPLYGLDLARQQQKKKYLSTWEADLQPLGPMLLQ